MSERAVGNLAPERVRSNFRLDLGSAVLGATMFGFVAPFMPIVVRRAGGSDFEVAFVIAGAFFGHLLSPLGAYALARVPLVLAVAIPSALGRTLFAVFALLAATPLGLSVPYVVFWILTLSNVAPYTALMSRIYPDDQRATAMGRVRIAANLATLVVAFAGGAVLQITDDPARVLAIAGIVSIAGNAVFLGIRHDEPAVRPLPVSPLRFVPEAWRDDTFRRFLIAAMVFGFANIVAATLYPLLLVDRFNAPDAFVGLYSATSAGATMIGYWFWGKRIDRGSSMRLSLASTSLILAMPVVFLLAPNMWLLLVAAAVNGFSFGCGDLTFVTNILQLAPKGKATEYTAVQSFVLGVRGVIAPFVASGLLAFMDASLVLAAAIVFMTLGIVLWRDVVARVDQRERVVAVRPA